MTAHKSARRPPPWPIRVLGGILLVADITVFATERVLGQADTTVWGFAGHGLWAVIALTMVYPEGAWPLLGYVRRTVPFLDRRRGRRDSGEEERAE